MFPHEEFLKKALEECQITRLVQDLGNLYVSLVNMSIPVTPEQDANFKIALKVCQILQKAADEIADLGPKPQIPHPMDKNPFV